MNDVAGKFLKSLETKRRDWLRATRENNFEDGIWSLLSDLYPDQAHFIFELLQNAEDAKASWVRFNLQQNRLEMTHNGQRLFTSGDVESITKIGKSTKKNDVNKIGKFGIGFKAVFGYTSTPQIHSGEYHFEIRDLVCPFSIEPRHACKDETVFIFPFNGERKPPDICYQEIKGIFKFIDHSVLLFLKHIESIEWVIDEAKPGLAIRETDKEDAALIKISICNPAKKDMQEDAWFLRFQTSLPDHGELKCGVAFKLGVKLEKDTGLNLVQSLAKQAKIEPNQGKLCIFFPTEKEVTGLQFHINGPYASTIDRASIPYEHEDNKKILQSTAELVVDSLEEIKKNGLLNADLLEVLPNTQDDLGDFYAPLRDVILKIFYKQELVPTDDNQHAAADHVYQGPEQLRKVITKKELSFFVDKDSVSWAKGVQSNSRADKFLSSLEIPQWGNKEFLNALDDKFSHKIKCPAKQKAQAWLKQKSDGWMRDFYLLLDSVLKKEKKDLVPNLQIIRTESNGLIDMCFGGVYLPVEGAALSFTDLNGNYTTVKKALFDGLGKHRTDQLRTFFKRIGVQEMKEVKAILEQFYKSDPCPAEKDHQQHIQSFIKDFQKHRNIDSFKPGILDGPYEIFRDASGKYHAPSSFYLDTPFSETGLNALYCQKYQKKFALWAQYKDILGFENFAQALGVQSVLKIKKSSTDNNPKKEILQVDVIENHAKNTKTKIDDDYTIDDIENILRCQDIGVAKFVWGIMCQSNVEYQEATFRPNKQYDIKTVPSRLIHYLRSIPWIPNKDEEFCLPEEVSKDDLCESFNYDNSNGWLKTIGFKVAEPGGIYISEEQSQEYEELKKQKEQRSKDEGEGKNPTEAVITPSKIDVQAEFYKAFNRKGKTEIHESITDGGKVINPGHRRTKDNEGYNEDLDAEPTPDERRKTTRRTILEEPNEQVRTFLDQLYGGKCQICNKTFPQRNGRPFFVANYMIPRRFARYVDNSANALCLCANHFAKWQHGAVDENNILDQLYSFKTEKESDGEHRPPILRIKLCGKDCEITFKEKHFLDLQELLRASANHE